MAGNTKENENFNWGDLNKWGLERLLMYWKAGSPRTQEYRLTKIILSFLKGFLNEQKKQTKFLEEIRDSLEQTTTDSK